MNVLSLFDGMSCGQQALERAGIEVNQYFASEIDKYAIQVTMANYPNTIQLGSVVGVDGYALPKIDLLIGGSPCQSFSFAGKRKGMATTDEQEILTLKHYLKLKAEGYEFEGQSYLFWEFMRLLYEVKPKYFLLENVEMGEKWERVLTQAIGVNALHINSALVSAQNRKRIYFTNIGMEAAGLFGYPVSIIKKPKDRKILLKDILESEVDEKYFLSDKGVDRIMSYNNADRSIDDNDKSLCLASVYHKQGRDNQLIVHNTQRRDANRPSIQKNKNAGGSGHLSRNDGKTYCLDGGNTNAVEVREVKQLSTNNKLNGGTQPYQQDRIYDVNGISPALQAQLPNGSTMINTSRIRRLTPLECQRLQTVNDNYNMPVSDSQKYKMLGNGWTIEVISHIFKYIL
jgi:DNA (cytosine-5)-methyltransferase 3A